MFSYYNTHAYYNIFEKNLKIFFKKFTQVIIIKILVYLSSAFNMCIHFKTKWDHTEICLSYWYYIMLSSH